MSYASNVSQHNVQLVELPVRLKSFGRELFVSVFARKNYLSYSKERHVVYVTESYSKDC